MADDEYSEPVSPPDAAPRPEDLPTEPEDSPAESVDLLTVGFAGADFRVESFAGAAAVAGFAAADSADVDFRGEGFTLSDVAVSDFARADF